MFCHLNFSVGSIFIVSVNLLKIPDRLAGRMATMDIWSQERIHHQLGVTRGSLRSKGPERTSRFSR